MAQIINIYLYAYTQSRSLQFRSFELRVLFSHKLLIRMTEVQLSEESSLFQGSEQVFHFRYRIPIQRNPKVSAESNGLFILAATKYILIQSVASQLYDHNTSRESCFVLFTN